MNTRVYSQRLGTLADAQFAAAVERLGLGTFVAAAPTQEGLFGQNVFVTTTQGEYVLRGAPHWVKGPNDADYRPDNRWQFAKEAYFVEQLHAHTRAPVPWPYLRDERSDIFGWPYVIMPRMPGVCWNDRALHRQASRDDAHAIARALAVNLVELQRLRAPFCGDFDVNTIALAPAPEGNVRFTADEVERIVASACTHDALDDADIAWIRAHMGTALAAGARPNTYVHCDYKLANLTLLNDAGGWRVGGLFDFHEARFADGAIDLVRQACAFLDYAPDLARTFLRAYLELAPGDATLAHVLPLYVVNDRLKIWDYFTRPGVAGGLDRSRTFRAWCGDYLDRMAALVAA